MSFDCDICHANFTKNLVRHKKNKHKKNSNSKTNKKEIFKCSHCKRSLSRSDALKRHMKTCKIAKNAKIDNNNGIVLKDLKECKNIKINQKKYDNIKKYYNENMFNINLIFFGKDGIENITEKDLKEIFQSKSNLLENMIKNVNLNPNKPQHHNILYDDMKSTYGEVYENNKWVKKKIYEIINVLLDSKITDLKEIMDDMKEFLNEPTQTRIRRAIETADYSQPDARKKLISYIKPILFNNKDMIIKTRKGTKEEYKPRKQNLNSFTEEEESVEEI